MRLIRAIKKEFEDDPLSAALMVTALVFGIATAISQVLIMRGFITGPVYL
jgi:multisubunit Na+/H+ antiporter MnhC subunit